MKTTLPLHCAIAACAALILDQARIQGQTGKVAGQVAERALSPIAKEAAEKAAKELVQNAAASAGKQVAERTAQTLEAQLAKTIGQYGEAVVTLARRVPEATEALANRAPQLLPLAERLGDDILRVEARAPGYAEMASKSYGKDELPRLLRLPNPEMEGVLRLSTHVTEPRAAKLLLEGTEKGGMNFLKNVSGPQILATGLSVATILAVSKIPQGPEIVHEGGKLLAPITAVAAALLAAWGGLAIWRTHRRDINH